MSAVLSLPTIAAESITEVSSLADLAPGEKAIVHGVDMNSPMGRRLIDLGFRPGTPLKVVRRAPMGDPVSYELRGSRFCLRRSEAEQIAVIRSPEE